MACRRTKLGLLLLVALLSIASNAYAEQKALVRASGGGALAARVQDELAKLLENHGWQIASGQDADGAELTKKADRIAIAQELGLTAIVDANVRARGKTAVVVIKVFDGRGGAQLGKANVRATAKTLDRELRKAWPKLSRPLQRAKAPKPPPRPAKAKPAPAPPVKEQEIDEEELLSEKPPRGAEQPEQADDDESAGEKPEPDQEVAEGEHEATEGPALSALEIGVGIRVLKRNFNYNDAPNKLPEHSLEPTPALRLDLRWYPGAHFGGGFVSNIGLELYGQLMWPVKATSIPTMKEFETTSSEFGIGARVRVPLSEHQLGVFVGYGVHGIEVADAMGVTATVPSVTYSFLRLGADARFKLSEEFGLGLRAAFLPLLGYGELAAREWFPHVSGSGIEVQLSAGYSLSKAFEIGLAIGVTRYAFSLSPEPTDPGAQAPTYRIAGGVVDQLLHGLIGVTWRPQL